MASSKPKTAAKSKTAAKPKTTAKSAKTVAKPAVRVEKKVGKTEVKAEKKTCKAVIKDFFAKKCDPSENILTIFRNKKLYAALIAELIGTMVLTIILLTLGVYQPLYIFFVILVITTAMFKLSGSNFNPIITVGMMASRRMSAIRGVLYILAQVLGAWCGLLIVNSFRVASGTEVELQTMSAVAEGMFWPITMIEFFGATLVGFFFAKALQYRRSPLTFAVIVAGGVMIAFVAAYIISYNYFSVSNNFMINPAVALMYQILPSAGDTFGGLLGEVALALLTYVIFPMLGGVVGFYISDIAEKLNGEDLKM